MGASRVFQLDFVSLGQSNVDKIIKAIHVFIKLDIHATSRMYRVTLLEQHWYTMDGFLTSHVLPRAVIMMMIASYMVDDDRLMHS